MQEFQLSRYIKKWLPWIVIICLISTAGVYVFLSGSQKYVASAVINYDSEGADEGLTPKGTELDVNEIKSSGIMSQVVSNLGLENQAYSLDDLVSRISIEEVEDEDETARKEALLDEGEEYTYEPTTFIISFEANHNEGESFARMILDEVLDVYFTQYSENYLNSSTVSNSLSEIYNGSYDYIEMLDIIEENIMETTQSLQAYSESEPYYRAVSTGVSYSDLLGEFNIIRSVDISILYSKILQYQISKDKDLLMDTYREKIKNYEISNDTEEEQIEDVVRIIEAYVEKMRDSDNTNITYNYILDEVYDKNLLDSEGNVIGEGDQTVTYDKLIYSWRDHNMTKEAALIDIAYCTYLLETFEKTAVTGTAYEELRKEVEDGIRDLTDRLMELYTVVDETNAEYNAYAGAKNISMLSTVSVDESINVMLYMALAMVFLLIVCCCGAVLLGRLNDIIQYVFYTDHMTGLRNRTAFDGFLAKHDKRILGNGVACVTISVENQIDINKRFGREMGDQILRLFADDLKEVFTNMDIFPVYNGNAYFVAIINRVETSSMDYILERFRILIDKREILPEAQIEYQIGWSESKRDDAYNMRELLSKATNSRQSYVSGGGK